MNAVERAQRIRDHIKLAGRAYVDAIIRDAEYIGFNNKEEFRSFRKSAEHILDRTITEEYLEHATVCECPLHAEEDLDSLMGNLGLLDWTVQVHYKLARAFMELNGVAAQVIKRVAAKNPKPEPCK